MAVYVMLTNLTEEGRKTLKQSPDRLKEVNKEVEAMGVKILCQYALLGQYDFINILEAPDNQAIAKVALELGARGTLKTMTMAAMAIDAIPSGIYHSPHHRKPDTTLRSFPHQPSHRRHYGRDGL